MDFTFTSEGTFDATRFDGNVAEYDGGAIQVRASATISTTNDCEFVNNSAERGGAIACNSLAFLFMTI